MWPGTWWDRSADVLKTDLAAANVPYVVATIDGPRYADFHALRHTFITGLVTGGVNPRLRRIMTQSGSRPEREPFSQSFAGRFTSDWVLRRPTIVSTKRWSTRGRRNSIEDVMLRRSPCAIPFSRKYVSHISRVTVTSTLGHGVVKVKSSLAGLSALEVGAQAPGSGRQAWGRPGLGISELQAAVQGTPKATQEGSR